MDENSKQIDALVGQFVLIEDTHADIYGILKNQGTGYRCAINGKDDQRCMVVFTVDDIASIDTANGIIRLTNKNGGQQNEKAD